MDNKNFVASDEAPTFVAPNGAPPPQAEGQQGGSQQAGPPPDYFSDDLPPAYQVASALPTYEESELTKGKLFSRMTSNICETYCLEHNLTSQLDDVSYYI